MMNIDDKIALLKSINENSKKLKALLEQLIENLETKFPDDKEEQSTRFDWILDGKQ